MKAKTDSIPYEVQIKNFLYELNKQPYKAPTEDDLAAIEEETFYLNGIYREAVRPVIELIQMGRIEEAKKTYGAISTTQPMEPAKVKVKK